MILVKKNKKPNLHRVKALQGWKEAKHSSAIMAEGQNADRQSKHGPIKYFLKVKQLSNI